jgi:hypothetical protein
LLTRYRTLTRQTTSNTEAILDNTDDIITGIARLREAISRREDGTREGSTYVLQAYLEELTSYAGSVLGDGDNELENSSVVTPADALSIAASSHAESLVEDIPRATDLPNRFQTEVPTDVHNWFRSDVPTGLPTDVPTGLPTDVPNRFPADVPNRFPMIQNEPFTEDPPSYFMVQNADRNRIRRIRRRPIRWEHHPEFDNIGLENAVDTSRRLRCIQEIEQVPDWKVQPSGGGERYKKYVDYRVTEQGYVSPGRTARGHLIGFWKKRPSLRTNAEKIKWFNKFTTSGGDVNSVLELTSTSPTGHREYATFGAIMIALLTRNEEWLDYLIAEGAEIGPTHYTKDIFSNPVNMSGNSMVVHGNRNRADMHGNPAFGSGLSPLKAALNWNFAAFRKLEDRYTIIQLADFLDFVSVDHSPHVTENFTVYVAGYFISELARTQTRRAYSDILSTVLDAAIAQNNVSLVRLLLTSGTSLNDLRFKPFEIALGQSYWEIVELLIAAGESLNRRLYYARGYNPMSAWEYAALLGNLDELNRIQGTDYQVLIPQPPPPGPGCIIL